MSYRSCYDQEIWPTKKQEFIAKAQAFRQGKSRKDQLVSDLLAADISEQGVKMLASIATLDWESWEDAGRLVWGDDMKRAAAYAARERYYDDGENAAAKYNNAVANLWATEIEE